MENASKALIIAGAILLAIIIISLGIAVVNNASAQTEGADLSKQQIQTFNNNWDMYVGDKKTASQVLALISDVIASNASQANSTGQYITLTGTGSLASLKIGWDTASKKPITNRISLSSLNTYNVQIGGYSSTGYVNSITVAISTN